MNNIGLYRRLSSSIRFGLCCSLAITTLGGCDSSDENSSSETSTEGSTDTATSGSQTSGQTSANTSGPATTVSDSDSTPDPDTSGSTSGDTNDSQADTNDSQTDGSGGADGATDDGSDTGVMVECPEAPPAGPKDPEPNVFEFEVSKEEYQQLILPQTPFEGTRGTLPWHMWEPDQAAANPNEQYPLILTLHGGYGREVTDGNILVDSTQYLLGSSNGLLTDANREQFPIYIVSPHCRVEEGCDFGTNEWASAGGAFYEIQDEPSVAGQTAIELVEYVIANYQVDPSRIYVTGNSMGGGGTWEFVTRRPDLFAAAIPVAGHTPQLSDLDALAAAKVPVWAFTGANDNVNSHLDTDMAIEHLDSMEGCAWVTKYNNTGHEDILWANPYLEPELWPWLFAQQTP